MWGLAGVWEKSSQLRENCGRQPSKHVERNYICTLEAKALRRQFSLSICHDIHSMAHPGFGHLWKQAEMSDMDIAVICTHDEDSEGDERLGAQEVIGQEITLLQQFPGHSMILSSSPYFKAQILRWPTPAQPLDSSQSRDGTATSGTKRQAKQQVTITLPNSSYVPAAMAVLAGLYLVQPWRTLMADLTPQQQVHAAVLADMWQLPAASEAAVVVLQEPTNSDDKLSAVLEQLLSMAVMPDCLVAVLEHCWMALLSKYRILAAVPASVLPVIERVLLSKYGDLEAVWAPDGASLQDSLLALPLYAMEVLLASDKLKVASEDTVLYTAQAYTEHLELSGSSSHPALNELARLVRCPHLSQYLLSASVLSIDADKLVLRRLQPQLMQLLLLKAACRPDASLSADDLKGAVVNAPGSWLLPVRDIQPVSSASIQWELDAATIRQAAQTSASQEKTTILKSPTSCLLGGISWGLELYCHHSKEGEDGSLVCTEIGLYARAKSLPSGSLCRCTYTVECVGVDEVMVCKGSNLFHSVGNESAWGRNDFFKLGPMAGGFDEVAWAAKGLPASGNIVLQLTVADIGM